MGFKQSKNDEKRVVIFTFFFSCKRNLDYNWVVEMFAKFVQVLTSESLEMDGNPKTEIF